MNDDKLAALLGDYRSWLYRLASQMATGADVDDLAQEGAIAMWRATKTYDESKGPIAGWLTMKARYRMLECAARRKPPDMSLEAGRGEDGLSLADLIAGPDLMSSTELAYHRGQILAALNALTPAQRKYVVARFWNGMNTRELTELFGYDPGGLWRSARNGARGKLAIALAQLENA